MNLLNALTQLSQEFGTPEYLKGGGGNTSVKDRHTLWIKPSGTSLPDMKPERFVAMERTKLAKLYEAEPPRDAAARETWVRDIMMASVRPGSKGRPSVEAPLHNLFEARYVVHTHPALVNGMTAAKQGAEVCRQLFPDALWMDYTDPGYTLCMAVLDRMKEYTRRQAREPKMVFLGNHGVFVAGNTAEKIRVAYAEIMARLRAEYEKAGVSMELAVGPPPDERTVVEMTERLLRLPGMEEFKAVSAGGTFEAAEGPVSPDQIVYMRSHSLVGEPTTEAVEKFMGRHGYAPRVIVCRTGVFGVGSSAKNAALALELAQDAAVARQLADAFGGPKYMTGAQGKFVDKWEAEAYRRKAF